MAHTSLLQAPEALDIHNAAAVYARATGLSDKEEPVQVSTLLIKACFLDVPVGATHRCREDKAGASEV